MFIVPLRVREELIPVSKISQGRRRIDASQVMLIVLVMTYSVLLVSMPELSPSDEYAFLPTLQSGKAYPFNTKDFPYYNLAELGRFNPIGSQEYNLVALISNAPLAYFLFNALLLIGFSLLFVEILKRTLSDYTYLYKIPIIVFLTPGFALTFTKLLYSDKHVLFYFSIFTFSFLVFQSGQKLGSMIVSLMSANVAIYYKEPAFLAIGAFSVVHLALTWHTSSRRARLLDVLLAGSAVLYIVLYAVMILPYKVAHQDYLPYGGRLVVFIKNLLNYGLFSDPIVVFLLFPLSVGRLHAVFVRRSEQAHPIHDPLLAAGSVYAAAYLILNMYGPYYFLPVYLFALPPIFYFLKGDRLRQWSWKAAVTVTVFASMVNAVPASLHYLAYNKYLPVNFNRTMDFLVRDINRRYSGERLSIFFDGVDRGTGRSVYFIVGEFLRFKGLPIDKFDLKSKLEAMDPSPFIGLRSPFDQDEDIERLNSRYHFANPQLPFSVFQPGLLPDLHSGDYLVVSPHSTTYFDGRYLGALRRDFDLVFHTESLLAIPRVNAKTLVKYWMIGSLSKEQRGQGIIVNENLWNWPDYYVFVKR